jgi:hypothetical protein
LRLIATPGVRVSTSLTVTAWLRRMSAWSMTVTACPTRSSRYGERFAVTTISPTQAALVGAALWARADDVNDKAASAADVSKT